MPLHDVGYRGWNGQRALEFSRWWVLAITGIQLVWRGTILKRTLVLTWLPAIATVIGFFLYEQASAHAEPRRAFVGLMRALGASYSLTTPLLDNPSEVRHEVWSTLLLAYFRYPQAIVMVLIIGMIAPRLIAYDIRTRGYLLVFSRPITPWEYVIGKSIVLWFYLTLITTVPAILVYLIGLLLSPDLSVVNQTWDLPCRVILASVALIVPTSALALAYSSLTVESRYAAFAWFATWILGWATYSLLTFVEVQSQRRGVTAARLSRISENWEFVSPYHVLGRVQQWCFGLTPDDFQIWPYWLILGSLCVLSFAVIYRRITLVAQL